MVTPVETHYVARALAWAKSIVGRIFAIGKRVATLEARVTELETKLSERPPDACAKCGKLAMRLHKNYGIKGSNPNQWRPEEWICKECGYSEIRVVRF